MQTIKVYGELAARLGRSTFKAVARNVAEAMRFLLTNFPWIEQYFNANTFTVSVDDRSLGEEELKDPVGRGTIRIVPIVGGAGETVGNIVQTVVGAVLVAVSVFVPVVAPIAGALLGVGASLALSGVAGLISPTPSLQVSGQGSGGVGNFTSSLRGTRIPTTRGSSVDPQESYAFSGIQNTTKPNTPLPIVYGETIVGSVVISAGFSTEQVAA
tara:strand:- start:6665 stop:7303 length:639 start_codon:yes stop_codon:yes gene_type:complete